FAKCATGCNTYVSPAGDFTMLVKDSTHTPGVVYDRRWPDGLLAKYDTLGRLVSVADRFGNTTSYAYKGLTGAAAGQLWTITDPAGKVITFAYDANGKLQTIQDPGGRVVHFTVNASGDLTDIVDPDGVKALHVTYDTHHMTQTYTDRSKSLWTLAYDRGGKVKSVVAPAVTVAGGSFQGTTAFRSVEALVLPDSAGTTGTSASPLTRQLSTKVRIKVTAPNGDSTLYALNRFGSPTLTWLKGPQGHPLVTTLQYNTNGQVTSVLDTALNATLYTWSGPDLLRLNDQKTGSEQEFAYESVYHQVVADSLDHSIVQKNFLSTLGGVDSVWVDSVIVAKYKYDARYRPITITDSAGHVDSVTYNTTGFLNTQWTSVPTASGGRARTSFTYDGYGRVQQTTDPLSRTASATLDSLNRTRSATGALGITVKFGYNDTTFTSTVTDPRNLTYTTVTNALGWVVSKTDTKGGVQRWTYDSLGDVASFTNRRNQVATFTYDHQGRLLTQVADGQTTKFAYDSILRWTADSNAESIDTTHFDNNGRPVMVVSIRGSSHDTLVYSYRPDGLPDKLTIQGGWANPKFNLYGYDPALRPNEITDFSENGTAIAYNGDGQESQYTLPTMTQHILHLSFLYNAGHLLDSLTADQGLPWYVGRHYAYDVVGRDTMVSRGTPSDLGNMQLGDMQIRTLTYDQADRLSGYIDRHDWDEDGGIVCPDPFDLNSCYRNYIPHSDTLRQVAFAYDSSGNWRGTGDTTEANSDRATALNGYHLQYDSEGNITQKTKTGFSQTLTWNTLGQLTQVVTVINGNSTTTTFGYNPLGQRIRKTVNGTVTRYLWNGMNLAMELDGSGNPLREYTYYPGIDRPLSLRRFSDGAMFYYTAEQPGHVATLVNSSNQVVNSYTYGPFGDSLGWSEQVPQPFKYGGREYDPDTRLYYQRSRYYDPALGRFVGEDPLSLAGGINVYSYVGNSPIDFTDPLGLVTCPKGTVQYEISQETGEDGSITTIILCENAKGQVIGTIITNGNAPVTLTGVNVQGEGPSGNVPPIQNIDLVGMGLRQPTFQSGFGGDRIEVPGLTPSTSSQQTLQQKVQECSAKGNAAAGPAITARGTGTSVGAAVVNAFRTGSGMGALQGWLTAQAFQLYVTASIWTGTYAQCLDPKNGVSQLLIMQNSQ
ncbi:MAG TPA: RHS repeat-associated core domain-containing protein, partial [Gemmatimonadales bacterium]|nr:RHS repeat-associated core domain-containing protein [Gemmatimonadales bacterium]